MASSPPDAVTYEDLTVLDTELSKIDIEITRQQWIASQPLYLRRKSVVSKIAHFWALVFDEIPPEIEGHITPADSEVFAEWLLDFDLDRFEFKREPRSFLLRFTFAPNPWFEDKILEKKFWHRRSSDNWQGYVSEPVKIRWKSSKHDLTNGLNDATCALWDIFKQQGDLTVKGLEKLKGNDAYKKVVKIVESNNSEQDSFFTMFSFISAYRYVDENESEAAEKAAEERHQRRVNGENVPDPLPESGWHDADDIMPCPHGEDLAVVLADDLFPNAIRYFTDAQEREHEGDNNSEEESSDEEDSSDDDNAAIGSLNIRKLVPGKSKRRKLDT